MRWNHTKEAPIFILTSEGIFALKYSPKDTEVDVRQYRTMEEALIGEGVKQERYLGERVPQKNIFRPEDTLESVCLAADSVIHQWELGGVTSQLKYVEVSAYDDEGVEMQAPRLVAKLKNGRVALTEVLGASAQISCYGNHAYNHGMKPLIHAGPFIP